jgi:DNA-binding transcriptional MocR family regulator
VSRAYDELTRRNLVDGQVGRGTYVRSDVALPDPPFVPERRDGEIIDLSMLKPVQDPELPDRFAKALRDVAGGLDPRILSSFRPNTVFRRNREVALGWLRLCGLETATDNVQITNGVTPAIAIALMAVARPGDTIATEAIGHHTLLPLTNYMGMSLKGIAIDREGMLPDALDEACAGGRIAAVFLVPTLGNPTVAMMGEARRRDIVAIARRRGLMLIENDALGPLVERSAPPFFALAPERSFYLTSFTKCVMPGLRTGYMVVPDDLIPSVANRQLVTMWMATPLIAEIAARWVADGTALDLARRQRRRLRARNATARTLLDGLGAHHHQDALHVWLPLRPEWREDQFVSQARLHGVAVAPGASFITEPGQVIQAVRISIGSSTEPELAVGLKVVERLARSAPEPALLTI